MQRAFLAGLLALTASGCGLDGPTPQGSRETAGPNGSPQKPIAVPQNPEPSPPSGGGVKYEFGVSEEKLQKHLETLDNAAKVAITDEQVFAIMGQPTRRDTPMTGQKDGQTITFYAAHWAVPGKGIESQIAFVNGHIAAMILQGVKNRSAPQRPVERPR